MAEPINTHTTATPLEMSRSPTVTNDDQSDPARTLTDVTTSGQQKKVEDSPSTNNGPDLPAESTIGVDLEKAGLGVHTKGPNVLASLPNGRKTVLLLCFCTAMFM